MPLIEPFRVAIPDEVLDDLATRLKRTRIPSPPILDGGESIKMIVDIEDLVDYWRDEYDWRAQERRLNAFPQYRATIDGIGIHFIHVRGKGPNPLPLLLANGWPSSFVEYLGVLGHLTDPAAYGGDPNDAFDVVIPAMPGYGFSEQCSDRHLDRVMIAGLFDRLMVEELGYGQYVAHGDDIGGGVVNRLGMRHPRTVRAIQTANWLKPHGAAVTDEDYLAAESRWEQERGAYAHVQATRPQILTYGLLDSPVGLAAWILEKFLTWSDPATRGNLTADDLLTNVMIYWATRSIGNTMRLYAVDSGPLGADDVISVPASVLVTSEPELPVPPESWLRQAYPRLTRIATVDEGGHFLAQESPLVFADAVRTAFRPYRG